MPLFKTIVELFDKTINIENYLSSPLGMFLNNRPLFEEKYSCLYQPIISFLKYKKMNYEYNQKYHDGLREHLHTRNYKF